jgi:hypothetical protein
VGKPKRELIRPEGPTVVDEASVLGAAMADARERMVVFFKEVYKLSREDADARVESAEVEGAKLRILCGPAEVGTWFDLSVLAKHDPELAALGWARLKDVARGESISGHRAAEVVRQGLDYGPYDKARFLALRDDLLAEWDPSSSTERMLVDMLAQIHCAWEAWLGRHLAELEMGLSPVRKVERELRAEYGGVMPLHLERAESLEHSAAMVDRMQRMALRTIRALRDLRRYSPSIVVENAGQVNIGEKQVNVGAGGLGA